MGVATGVTSRDILALMTIENGRTTTGPTVVIYNLTPNVQVINAATYRQTTLEHKPVLFVEAF